MVNRADLGELGRPVARLVGHDPLLRPQGGQGGGDVGGSGCGAGGPSGDGAGPFGEGSSSAAAEVVAERARADAAEARNVVLTAQVAALEDFWGRVDRLTWGIPAQGFMDEFEEVLLETVMARERDYRPTLCREAIAVATVALVVVPGAVVGPVAPLEGAPP